MSTASKWILSAATSALGGLGMHGPALAETTQSATICSPYGNSNTSGLVATSQGLKNGTTGNLDVLCPVVRTKESALTCRLDPTLTCFKVKVDVLAPATCTMYSYGQPDGGWRGQSVSMNEAGRRPQTFELEIHKARVPLGSYQSVQCRLAPGSMVFGIRPQQ